MNKAVAISELKVKPVGEFLNKIQEAESKKMDIGELLKELLQNMEYRSILNIFLNFSKKMLRTIASFYDFDWSNYIDRFIDYANIMKLASGGVLNDRTIGN